MEGVLESYLPGFEQTTVRFLTAPVMGARFAQRSFAVEFLLQPPQRLFDWLTFF